MKYQPDDDADQGCASAIIGILFLGCVIVSFCFGVMFESGYCK